MAKKTHYVVWSGREPGIYTSWPEAEAQVKGYKGALYKGFYSLSEAQDALSSSPSSAPVRSAEPQSDRLEGTGYAYSEHSLAIYCDGACEPNPGPAGTGLALYRFGVLEELRYGLYTERGTNNTAELNGLYRALLIAEASSQPSVIYCDSQYAINSVTDWAYKWKANDWKIKSGSRRVNWNLIKSAHELFDGIRDRVQVLHVRGHSGDEGNELADRMAMFAIRQREVNLTIYDQILDVPSILSLERG